MCKIKVEELINTLETFEMEHCVSLSQIGERKCLEIWEEESGCTIDHIFIPES